MSSRVHHSSTQPWTTKNKVHNTRQLQQQIEKNSARQLVEAMKAQKAAALQEQAAANIPRTSNGNPKSDPSLNNALAVLSPLLGKPPLSGDPLHDVELPRALETVEDEDGDDDSDSGPTTQRSRHAPRRIVLDESWASDRPCKRRMSASRKNARLWQNILSAPPSLPSSSVSTSATASASVSASALPPSSPSPLPSSTLPLPSLQQTSTSSKATGTTMGSRVPSAKRGRPFRRPSERRPAGLPPSFDLLDKPPAGWKHPLGTYGRIQGSSCNSEGIEVIHDSDDRVERSRRVEGDYESQKVMEASATLTSILESKPNQAEDQPCTDGFVASIEKRSRRRRPQTPDSSDSEEDQLTASLLEPWRKSGSLGRSRASTSSRMSPDTAAQQSRQQETSPRELHGYMTGLQGGDTLAKAFQLSIHSEDEPMQSAAEDNGETYLKGDMAMDRRSLSEQRELTATPPKAVDAAPRPQSEDELEKARQRVEELCRSYIIIPEAPSDSSQPEKGEIVEVVMDGHSARDGEDNEIAIMDMDEDSSQSTPGTEVGETAENTLNKDNIETEDDSNTLVMTNNIHISPFERIKALAQRIPPSPSMINRQKFQCHPVCPMQHQWPYPPPTYYPGPIQIPHQGYHVPYGPCVPFYNYRQVPFNGYTEQPYVDTHTPSSWACVPYRREQHATDHQLPEGGECDLRSPTPGRDVAVQSPGHPFGRQSSSESTPRLSSASPSVASPEHCLPTSFVPPPPPGPRPPSWTPPLPPGPRPPSLTPPPPQDPRPSPFVPPLRQSSPPTSAAACPGLQPSLLPHPLQHDPVSPPDKALVMVAPRLSVSPLTTPEPLSRDATAEQSADETVAAPVPPAKFRKLAMREKLMLDQNKIKRIADLSKQMLEKQERLIKLHSVHFPETPLKSRRDKN
ncbi:unnamed protein product [Mortierella alpina]